MSYSFILNGSPLALAITNRALLDDLLATIRAGMGPEDKLEIVGRSTTLSKPLR